MTPALVATHTLLPLEHARRAAAPELGTVPIFRIACACGWATPWCQHLLAAARDAQAHIQGGAK